jgi:hypothetical protein
MITFSRLPITCSLKDLMSAMNGHPFYKNK